MAIRVESHQVLVPVFWGGMIECKQQKNKELLKCSWDGEVNDHVSRESRSSPEMTMPDDLGFVSPSSLRLFEDGVEQKIESLQKTSYIGMPVSDNLGDHLEAAHIPTAMWSTPDQMAGFFEGVSHLQVGHYFQLAYTPPVSPTGSCHVVKIAGPHESRLIYRSEYCNVVHPASDLLLGTAEGKKLEEDLADGKQGQIHPSVQSSFFYQAPGRALAAIDVEFPYAQVKPKDWHGQLVQSDLLIAVYGNDGRLIARQSEGDLENSSYRPSAADSYQLAILEKQAEILTLVRYDAQMELPPGDYKLKVAYGHGSDFGIAEVPLVIDDYDGKQLGISSIVLCKRVRGAGEKPVAKEFVPLVAGTNEYTPAADTDFSNGDALTAYFELYEPVSGQPQQAFHVNYTMRIRNQQTGAVVLQKAENADSWVQPGKSAIPIAVELDLSQLNLVPGKYQIEIQGTDSAGRSTPTRTAEFWID